MSQASENAAENWIMELNGEQLNDTLSALCMDTSGGYLRQAHRLQNWLLGNYSASEFVPDLRDQSVVIKERAERRIKAIETIMSNDIKNGTHTGEPSEHRLHVLTSDTGVQRNLERTLRISETPREPPSQEQPTPQDQDRMITLVSSNGTPFQIPADLSLTLAEMITEVRTMRKELENVKNNQPLSSTRREEGKSSGHVNFRDTFTIFGNSINETIEQENGVTKEPEAGGKQNSSAPQQTQGSFNQTPRFGGSKDVGQTVRKWNVKFSGKKEQSIDAFLARIEDCNALSNLSGEELLAALSELFTDNAATWYRNNKSKWRTWEDFTASARRWYGTSRQYQQRLLNEANLRTQGPDEMVRDYLTCLIGIMNKLSPPLEHSQQLDLLHRNMRSNLQKMVRRSEVSSVETLLDAAADAEQTLERERNIRPPPAPEASLLPEMAYRPPQYTAKPKTEVSAVSSQETKPSMSDITTLLGKLLDEKMQQFQFPTKNPNENQRKGKGEEPATNSGNQEKGGKTNGHAPKTGWRSGGSKPPGATPGGNKPKFDPTQPLKCYGCGELGFMRKHCPKCAGNEERSG